MSPDDPDESQSIQSTKLDDERYDSVIPATETAARDTEATMLALLEQPEGSDITLAATHQFEILQQRDEFGLPPRDVSIYRNGKAPKITQMEKATFLRIFAECGDVSIACRGIGRTRAVMYLHRKSDPRFAELWEEMKRPAFQALEDEARRRAMEKSDLLMIFMMKALSREVGRGNIYQDKPGTLANLIDANGQPTRLTIEWGGGRDVPLERVEKEDGLKIGGSKTIDLDPDEFAIEMPDKDTP